MTLFEGSIGLQNELMQFYNSYMKSNYKDMVDDTPNASNIGFNLQDYETNDTNISNILDEMSNSIKLNAADELNKPDSDSESETNEMTNNLNDEDEISIPIVTIEEIPTETDKSNKSTETSEPAAETTYSLNDAEVVEKASNEDVYATTFDIINDALVSNTSNDLNPDYTTGGKNIVEMIDNVVGDDNKKMTGGDIHDIYVSPEEGVITIEPNNTNKSINSINSNETNKPVITDTTKPTENVITAGNVEDENYNIFDLDNPFDQIYNDKTKLNEYSSSDYDNDDNDNEDEESDSQNSYNEEDENSRYITLINELKEVDDETNANLKLSGGAPPVERIRLINAFPYILKSKV